MKKIKIQEGWKVTIEDGTIIIEDMKYKIGDIVYFDFEKGSIIGIIRSMSGDKCTLLAHYYDDGSLSIKSRYTYDREYIKRHATEYEKKLLFDALAKEGKMWDGNDIVDLQKPEVCPFKKGDILFQKLINRHVMFFSVDDDGRIYCLDVYARAHTMRPDFGGFNFGDYTLATPGESAQFFAILEKNTGKVWDADKGELVDKQKRILVPKNIKIRKYSFSDNGDGLFISFNENTQLLGYNSCTERWFVSSLTDTSDDVQCELIPCKREDLKLGDTVFTVFTGDVDEDDEDDLTHLPKYAKYIGCDCGVYISNEGMPRKNRYTPSDVHYKVVPVN